MLPIIIKRRFYFVLCSSLPTPVLSTYYFVLASLPDDNRARVKITTSPPGVPVTTINLTTWTVPLLYIYIIFRKTPWLVLSFCELLLLLRGIIKTRYVLFIYTNIHIYSVIPFKGKAHRIDIPFSGGDRKCLNTHFTIVFKCLTL